MAVFDPGALGKRLRAARGLAGFANPDEVNRALQREFGVTYSPRGILAIERGEQAASLDQFMTLALLYDPPGGFSFFAGAVNREYLSDFERIFFGRSA